MRLGFDMEIVQTVKVYCKECGKYSELKLTRSLQRPRVHEVFEFYRQLEIPDPKQYGWWTDGMGELLCADCIKQKIAVERSSESSRIKHTTLPIKPLRAWRKERDMLQRDLAVRIGVSNSSVGFWEQGRSRPTEEHLASLAEILDIELEQIQLGGM